MKTVIKKHRLFIKKSWIGKKILIYIETNQGCYLYPHDEVVKLILASGIVKNTKSWNTGLCEYHWPQIPTNKIEMLSSWKLNKPLPKAYIKSLPTTI